MLNFFLRIYPTKADSDGSWTDMTCAPCIPIIFLATLRASKTYKNRLKEFVGYICRFPMFFFLKPRPVKTTICISSTFLAYSLTRSRTATSSSNNFLSEPMVNMFIFFGVYPKTPGQFHSTNGYAYPRAYCFYIFDTLRGQAGVQWRLKFLRPKAD